MFRPQNGDTYTSPSWESRNITRRRRRLCCCPRGLHPRNRCQSATYLKWWAVFILLVDRRSQSIGLSPSPCIPLRKPLQIKHYGRTPRDIRNSTSLLVGPISRDRFCGSGIGWPAACPRLFIGKPGEASAISTAVATYTSSILT